MTVDTAAPELVVLLDERGEAVGTADKSRVHHADTPLHLAFSCYLFDSWDRLLVTRRAVAKTTWPGVWTNSCCGHPGPDEPVELAVQRRVREELDLEVDGLRCALPGFRYRATAPDGVVENEVCPVFVGRVTVDPRPDPTEVEQWRWVGWPGFLGLARDHPWTLSPWAVAQANAFAAEPGHPAARP
jgi:isopentenyl-diphosphate delta-isomerase